MTVGVGLSSRLREPVTIQEKNLVDNGRGGRKRPDGGPEWIDVTATPIRAEIIALRGGEALTQSVQRSSQLYRVTIRNRPGVTTAHRLLWKGVSLNIRTAPPSTDRATLVMTCESGVAT